MEKSSYDFFDNWRSNPDYLRLRKPILVADDLRTPENMGSVLRLAGNIGAEKTIFISKTAHTFRKYKINRTASGANENTDWRIVQDISQLKQLLPVDYQIIAIETAEGATNIFEYQFPKQVVLLVGSEISGISGELMELANASVFIPIPGPVSSLNVTHALSIALFEWLRQMMK